MLRFGRQRAAGIGLLLGGLLVLGSWTFLGWAVPLFLLGLAVVLAWRRSVVGVAVSVLGAGILFGLGMTFGWIAWAVGIGLSGTGILLVAWPLRNQDLQDAGHG
jgi:hypothetical protein